MEVYTSKNIDDLPGVIDPRYVTHEENKYTMYAFDDTEELLDFERFEIEQVLVVAPRQEECFKCRYKDGVEAWARILVCLK